MRLLARPAEAILAAAERLRPVLANTLGSGFTTETVACSSQIGSGALPTETVSSAGIALKPADGSGRRLTALADALRALPLPVIGRIEEGTLILDLRCLEDEAGFLANLASLSVKAGDGLA